MVRCKSKPVDGVGTDRPSVNKLRIVHFCIQTFFLPEKCFEGRKMKLSY